MKRHLILIPLFVIAVGCSTGTDNSVVNTKLPAGTGKPTNPSGVINNPTEQKISTGMSASGQNSESNAAKAAAGFKGH